MTMIEKTKKRIKMITVLKKKEKKIFLNFLENKKLWKKVRKLRHLSWIHATANFNSCFRNYNNPLVFDNYTRYIRYMMVYYIADYLLWIIFPQKNLEYQKSKLKEIIKKYYRCFYQYKNHIKLLEGGQKNE
jgi:predicted DNA-binding protein YlxM (UPF0122 family)